MRVLICDQESEMLETIARSFDVDTATSKATCVDLMRANPFDVLVASERLSDGSGLELLSHVASRWAHTLRVLAIEPQRLKLLGGKLAPFRLHATIRYPIDEDELEAVLGRMYELMGETGEQSAQEEAPPPPPAPAPAPRPGPGPRPGPRPGPSSPPKAQSPQAPARPASRVARMPTPPSPGARAAHASTAPRAAPVARDARDSRGTGTRGANAALGARTASKPTSSAARAGQPLGAPVPRTAPPVRRKLGNYTPLGAPEDEQLRIVEREFDQTVTPLAARAIRTREEATRPRTPKEKLGTLAQHLRHTLRRLLKR